VDCLKEKEFQKKTEISDYKLNKLNKYLYLLNVWQEKFNLISIKSVEFIWDRHVLDSYQILKIIGNNKTIIDIGSGAGFPGIVCAICSNNHFTLVESNKKKITFLNEVKNKINLKNISIHHSRIENLKTNKNFDFISARAVSSLDNLMKLSKNFLKNNTKCIFLKGKTFNKEIQKAKKKYFFDIRCVRSITDINSRVLVINNIMKK